MSEHNSPSEHCSNVSAITLSEFFARLDDVDRWIMEHPEVDLDRWSSVLECPADVLELLETTYFNTSESITAEQLDRLIGRRS